MKCNTGIYLLCPDGGYWDERDLALNLQNPIVMRFRFSSLGWPGLLVLIFVVWWLVFNLIGFIRLYTDSDDSYSGLPKPSPEVLESVERARNGEVLVIHSDGRKEWMKTERGVEAAKEYEDMKADIEKQVREFKASGRE